MKRLSLMAAALALAFSGAAATAQEKYPSKPVKILVPYAPGGATDIITRLLAEQMRQSLGQSFVVENKSGAFGIPAIEEMARSKPDGHTLMIGNVSTNAITPILFQKKFTIDFEKEVVSVNRLATLPSFLIVTTKNFPVNNVKEFVEYAKKNPDKVRYGSAGVGSFPHFDMEVFARRAGNLSMVHIPHKTGAAGMLNDLVNGDMQAGFINVASTAAMIKAGNLKPIAVLAEKRLEDYPDVPTLAEAGYPGVGTMHWQSMLAPANTPKDVLATLHKASTEGLKAPAVQDAFKKQLISATPSASVDEAQTWLKSELASWKKIVSEVKIDLTD